MAKRNKMFTQYDVLDEKGFFDGNTANPTSLDYKKEEYPKMVYHPGGDFRQTVAPEIIMTALGPKEVGEQKELIWRIVQNEQEEKALLEKGWHNNPRDSILAGGGFAPQESAVSAAVRLEKENAELKSKLARAEGLAGTSATKLTLKG